MNYPEEYNGNPKNWSFVLFLHCVYDDLIHPSEPINMMENLRAKSMKSKLTIYEGVVHYAWELAYADPELYKRLLAQRLKTHN